VQHHRSDPSSQEGCARNSVRTAVHRGRSCLRGAMPFEATNQLSLRFTCPRIGFQRPRSSGPEPIPFAPPATENPTCELARARVGLPSAAQHRLLPGAWNKHHCGETVTVIKATVRAPYECRPYRVEIAHCCCGDTPSRTTDNAAVGLHNLCPCETSPDSSDGLTESPSRPPRRELSTTRDADEPDPVAGTAP
jgi:hypothetical protein